MATVNAILVMKLIQTTTDLFPILRPNLYESAISPSVVFDWEQQQLAEELPESINPYDMGIDLKKYLNDISEIANEVLETEVVKYLQGFGIFDIKAMHFNHPEWYQLGSGRMDIIDLNILVEDSFFEQMAENLERFRKDEDCQKYIINHWKDRSGFWSFMPQSVDELINGWQYQTEERRMSAYLTLLCLTEGIITDYDETYEDNEAQREWEERIGERLYFTEYISEEDFDLIVANRQIA